MLLLLLAAFAAVDAYPGFLKLIPNGEHVPHPCNRTLSWRGVGHELPEGNGPRNQFGNDFMNVNKTWSQDLCRKDSDGDGKSNGEELGDPKCVWTIGQTPTITEIAKLSHPGVCEPLDSPKCAGRNKFLATVDVCAPPTSSPTSWCPAIAAPFVQKLDFHFDATKLPATDTFYLCKQFTVPSDKAYHIIAWEPVIVNPEVVHHMIVYSCDNPDEEDYLERVKGYPNTTECPMTPACGSMVVAWAFGSPKRCYGNEVGIPVGKNYYSTMILQIHYNNPSKLANVTDFSGVSIYFTPVLRPNEKALIAIGQTDIAVPPKTPSTSIIARGFSGECSRKQLAPYSTYRLVSVLFHMHQAGVYGRLIMTKNSTGERVTIIDEAMSYDRPKFLSWEASTQIAIEPGDSFEVECRYDTSSRTNWTFWGGFASTDEMCYAFLDVYPRPQNRMFIMPADLGELSWCTSIEPIIGNCSKNSIAGVLQNTEQSKSSGMMASCSCPGAYPAGACSSTCYSFLSRAGLLTNPCMRGMTFHSITRFWISMVPADIYNIQSVTNLCIKATSPPANNTVCLPPPSLASTSSGTSDGNNKNSNTSNSSNSDKNSKNDSSKMITLSPSLLFFALMTMARFTMAP